MPYASNEIVVVLRKKNCGAQMNGVAIFESFLSVEGGWAAFPSHLTAWFLTAYRGLYGAFHEDHDLFTGLWRGIEGETGVPKIF